MTTPQQVALGVANKGLQMFKHVNVPIIGIVENLTVQYLASGYRDIVAFLVLVVVLVLRPQGLLGRRMRAV